MINPDEKAVDGVFGFRGNLASDEQEHQRRHQKDGEHRGGEHRKSFCVCERLEQTSFLSLQAEDRQEGNGNDQQREKQRAADLLGGVDQYPVSVSLSSLLFPLLQLLVGVFDHDDRRINHDPDGDGDAPERHDVRIDAEEIHADQRHENGNGQHEDRHQRAAQVKQEHDADQAYNQAFFQKFFYEVFYRTLDQVRAVVDRDDFDAIGKRAVNLLQFFLHTLDHVQGIFAVADDDDAAHDLALAVEVGHAAADIRPQVNVCHITHIDGRAVGADSDGNALDVGNILDVAEASDHVFPSGVFDDAPADVVIASPNGLDHFLERNVVTDEGVGIDIHLVLLYVAADAGRLGHARHAFHPVADVPIL